jgi:hypothetical protein
MEGVFAMASSHSQACQKRTYGNIIGKAKPHHQATIGEQASNGPPTSSCRLRSPLANAVCRRFAGNLRVSADGRFDEKRGRAGPVLVGWWIADAAVWLRTYGSFVAGLHPRRRMAVPIANATDSNYADCGAVRRLARLDKADVFSQRKVWLGRSRGGDGIRHHDRLHNPKDSNSSARDTGATALSLHFSPVRTATPR